MKTPRLEYCGNGNNPIITIDDYASSADKLIEFAISQGEFNSDARSFHPGLRSQLPKDYVFQSLEPLIPHLYSIYKIDFLVLI